MHWKLKAAIQNTVAAFPEAVSHSMYYWIQRRFGGLRLIDPIDRLAAGIDTWRLIQSVGINPADRIFFEVGTGPAPMVPISYWLMGARHTITVDLNPYLKEPIVRDALAFVAANPTRISHMFGDLLHSQRFETLLQLCAAARISLREVFDLCCIRYVAPANAADTGLAAASVDFHTSFTVFEHIPEHIVQAILIEGNRIVRDDGLFVHFIDYSDHFSHSDDTISSVNFLQFSDTEWASYAGNRYTYANRMRHDDFLALFRRACHTVLAELPNIDARALNVLSDVAFPLDDRFRAKPLEVLAASGAWIVSRRTAETSRTSPWPRGARVQRQDGDNLKPLAGA